MANVTYLLGAGASANALPVVNQIPQRIYQTIAEIKSNMVSAGSNEDAQIITQSYNELIADLEWLQNNTIQNNNIIDKFAKKLSLSENQESLSRLKLVLSALFSYWQFKNPVDYRYDTFLTTILRHRHKFPNNCRILSWNYDFQFERAYYSVLSDIEKKQISYKTLRQMMNIAGPHNYHKASPNFQIFKLNGSCMNLIYQKDPASIPEDSDLLDFNNRIHNNLQFTFVKNYYDFKKNIEFKRPSMRFAWEDYSSWDSFSQKNDFLSSVISQIRDTNILVIIGYSFPDYNSQIDSKILSHLNNIQKVYIQDPNANNIKEKFSDVAPHIKNNLIDLRIIDPEVNNPFYIPKNVF